MPNSTYSQNLLLTRFGCQILDLSQAIPQHQTFTVEIVVNPPGRAMGQWNTRERKCRKPAPPPPTILRQALPTGELTLPGGAGLGKKVRKLQRTKPNTRGTGAGRKLNRTCTNSMPNQNTRRRSTTRQDPNCEQTSWNPSENFDAGQNSNPNPKRGGKSSPGSQC